MLTIKKEVTTKTTKYFGLVSKSQAIAITLATVFTFGLYTFVSNFGEVIAWAVQNKDVAEWAMMQQAEAKELLIKGETD